MRRLAIILLGAIVASVTFTQFLPSPSELRDRPSLFEAQATMTPLFVESARIVDPNFDISDLPQTVYESPLTGKPDAFEYDECDYWWNLLFPGWFTSVHVTFLASQVNILVAQNLIEYWSTQAGDVSISGGLLGSIDSRLEFSLGTVSIALQRGASDQSFDLFAYTTRCLPLS